MLLSIMAKKFAFIDEEYEIIPQGNNAKIKLINGTSINTLYYFPDNLTHFNTTLTWLLSYIFRFFKHIEEYIISAGIPNVKIPHFE